MNKCILVIVRARVFLRLWQSSDGICTTHEFVLTWIRGEGEGVNETREYTKPIQLIFLLVIRKYRTLVHVCEVNPSTFF